MISSSEGGQIFALPVGQSVKETANSKFCFEYAIVGSAR